MFLFIEKWRAKMYNIPVKTFKGLKNMERCRLCPRECGVDRSGKSRGFCKSPDAFFVSKIMLHKWEEPCISGERGVGTIFFGGCNLGCIYCQNRAISRGERGEIMTDEQLEAEIFALCDKGASCIEFVTPTHYTKRLASLLCRIKDKIPVPVVYNSGGYDSTEALKGLDGLIDIYMPDFKYFSSEIAKKYSGAPDYADVSLSSLKEMLRQVGSPKYFDGDSAKLRSGVILRHLILPSHRQDSIDVLELVAKEVGAENVILSLMGQYTPDFYVEFEKENGAREDCKNLRRRITSFEYNSVLDAANRLGFSGYMQDISSSSAKYTPDF